MFLWIIRLIVLLQICCKFKADEDRDHHYIICKRMTIIHKHGLGKDWHYAQWILIMDTNKCSGHSGRIYDRKHAQREDKSGEYVDSGEGI